jgi:hypothetical protein
MKKHPQKKIQKKQYTTKLTKGYFEKQNKPKNIYAGEKTPREKSPTSIKPQIDR